MLYIVRNVKYLSLLFVNLKFSFSKIMKLKLMNAIDNSNGFSTNLIMRDF